MKRWIAAFLGLCVTMGTTIGCQQKCFISEKNFYDAHLIPPGLEDGDNSSLVLPDHGITPAPPNVDHPDRPARNLSLQEALAISLENGATGARNGGVNTPGTVDDSSLINTGGSYNGQSDRVRVLALQPAISGANIEAALARFDAIWVTGFTNSVTDELLQGLSSFNNGTKSDFNTSIVKPLASGGVANVSFDTTYQLLSQPPAGAFGVINPNYTARLTFGLDQPLLKNFGSDINQLLNRIAPISSTTLPASASNAYNTQQSNLTSAAGQPLEGILITRLRFDQQRAEFERQMHNLLLNVEVAYWKLYEAYGALYSNEEVLRVLHKTWIDNYYKAQGGTISLDILAQIRGQYEEFRGERTNALGAVLEAERNLRGIMGLPVEDGTRLVPVTPPTLAPFQPNWEAALSDALIHRPELVLARENLRFHQLALVREKNSLQPDLRFVAQYSPVGFGTRLDGDGQMLDGAGNVLPNNAFRSLASTHFNDYTIGLNLAVPLGYRFEHASVRSARLQLAQSFYVLKDQEDRVRRTLAQQYQELTKWYRLIEDRRGERRAYGESLKVKYKNVELGKKPVDLDLLDTQRRLTLALTKEYQAIAEYNNTLARVEFARGTIMQHNNVVIAENGLTPCAQVRAVDHERERTKALVLCERPDPIGQPGRLAASPDVPSSLEQPPAATTTVPMPAELPSKAPPSAPGPEFKAPVPKIVEVPVAPLVPIEPDFKSKSPLPEIKNAPLPPPANETTPSTKETLKVPPTRKLPSAPDGPPLTSDGPPDLKDVPPAPKETPPALREVPFPPAPNEVPPTPKDAPSAPSSEILKVPPTRVAPSAPPAKTTSAAPLPPPPPLPDLDLNRPMTTPSAPVSPTQSAPVPPPATGSSNLPPAPPIPDVVNEIQVPSLPAPPTTRRLP